MDWICSKCSEYMDECECASGPVRPETPVTLTLSVSFPDCGHTLSLLTGTTLPDSCPACSQGILPGQTRCEDYPCCGHTGADAGCMPRPEHTSAYWSRLADTMDEDTYSRYCDAIDRQEMGY
jgi:hypothetical protein